MRFFAECFIIILFPLALALIATALPGCMPEQKVLAEQPTTKPAFEYDETNICWGTRIIKIIDNSARMSYTVLCVRNDEPALVLLDKHSLP